MAGWGNAWGGAWGGAPAATSGGLMGPWATAWGMTPDAAQTQVDPLRALRAMAGSGGGEGREVSPSAPENRGPVTAADERARADMFGALGDYGTSVAKKTGMDVLGAYGMGMAPTAGQIAGRAVTNLAAPGSVLGLAGNVLGKQMGMAKPQGVMGKVAKNVISPAIGLGLGFMNPALGLAYGLMSPMAMDAFGDITDTREDEAYRDAMEDSSGYFGGRSASKDISGLAKAAGFENMAHAYGNQGYGPGSAARGMTNKDATSFARGGNPMGNTYGARAGIGFGNSIGGPLGGARAVDPGYGANMGGYAGLGIGNPSSYGGGRDNDRDSGGFGSNDGNSDTAGNAGYGR